MIIMNKNKVLFLLLAHLCVLSVWGQGFGKRILTNEDWYFNPGDGKYWGAEYYDHSQWRKLDLPHDWSIESVASPNLASCTGYLPGGIGWYRKELEISASVSFVGELHQKTRKILQFHKFII